MYQRAVVLLGVVGVCMSLIVGFYSVVAWEIVAVLITVFLGIPALILKIEKTRANDSLRSPSPKPAQLENEERLGQIPDFLEGGGKKNRKAALLPDRSKITKLNISNVLLERLCEEAKVKAVNRYDDAMFSGFSVQVYPFFTDPNTVTIYLYFYSKLADRICQFRFKDGLSEVEHIHPDKHLEDDIERTTMSVLPWRRSPQWMQFLDLSYSRIGPFAPARGTYYILHALRLSRGPVWWVKFYDGFTGRKYSFEWNGEEIRSENIKQTK